MSRPEEILGRIREALAVPSDAGVKATAGDGIRDVREARKFLPPGGETHAERVALFAGLATKLKSEFQCFPDMTAARNAWLTLSDQEGWALTGSHRHPLTEALLADTPVLWTDDQPATDELERVPVGVTACEALIAQTGSVLVTSRGCGGRALSVLPPVHLVIAEAHQLLPDMLAGFDHLRETYGDQLPSLISWITGASRTGDIERILVLGAHGPRRLLVWMIDPGMEGA